LILWGLGGAIFEAFCNAPDHLMEVVEDAAALPTASGGERIVQDGPIFSYTNQSLLTKAQPGPCKHRTPSAVTS
jgi:hypothetical protein